VELLWNLGNKVELWEEYEVLGIGEGYEKFFDLFNTTKSSMS